ncbi:hypothetical protein OEZ86_001308 [Tetradesmus obliquus]|nr:hypothetical protein OEZ86_001308 [Tetradesmus obliquus]
MNVAAHLPRTIVRCQARRACLHLQAKCAPLNNVTAADTATPEPHPQHLLGTVTLAASLLIGSTIINLPAAHATASAAPAEHAALASTYTTPAAGLQQLLPAAPSLADISYLQLVGTAAAAAEETPTGPETAAAEDEDDDGRGARTFVFLVVAVSAFTLLRGGSRSSSSSGNSAIDRDALEQRDRFPWSGFHQFGDDFDWVDDD